MFTDKEELALKEHIVKMSKLFYGLDKMKVKTLVYEYAKKNNKRIPDLWNTKQVAGEDWLKSYRKQSNDLSLGKPESTSLARAMTFNNYNVKAFFNNLKIIFCNLKHPPTRIWNLDETGVNTVPTSRQILCRISTKQVGQIRSGERDINITMCYCVSAAGMALRPAFVFSRVRFSSQMLRGAPAGSLGSANSSGWMKQDIFSPVLKHFIDNMSVSKDQPGVFIVDNHSNHITIEAVELAKEHSLSLLKLPPHSGHKLQPLDVGVFGEFKRFYTSFCDEWHQSHPGKTLSLNYVAELSNKAFVISCTLENITSSIQAEWNISLQFRYFYGG